MGMESKQPPYDFIMNSGASPQKRGLLPSNTTKKQRVLMMAGAGVVFLIIFGIVLSLFFNRPDPALGASLKMAQQHTELLRVADIGTRQAKSSTTRHLSATVKLSLQSSEDSILSIANKNRKLTPAHLNAAKNLGTDENLTSASQNNRFDEEFTSTIHAQISEYLKQIQVVKDATKSDQDKKTLGEIHDQLARILPSDPNH